MPFLMTLFRESTALLRLTSPTLISPFRCAAVAVTTVTVAAADFLTLLFLESLGEAEAARSKRDWKGETSASRV